MKVAVSIPEELFETAETVGNRLRVSRSRLYATALAEFLDKHHGLLKDLENGLRLIPAL